MIVCVGKDIGSFEAGSRQPEQEQRQTGVQCKQ